MLQLLEVGHVSTRTDEGVAPNRVQPLYVLEPCKRPVRGCDIRRDTVNIAYKLDTNRDCRRLT